MNSNDKDANLEGPERLVGELRALSYRNVAVPPEVDETILATATRHFARRRRRLRVLRWAGASAVAATLILAVLLTVRYKQSKAVRPPLPSAVSKEDFDRNGRVDILDAFALARHIETPEKLLDEWDMDGDGVIDRKDVDLIAMAAVRLERKSIQ